MEHPFAYRGHYRDDGEICHCPWGIAPGHEHLGAVKEASKLEWLEGRPDMTDPRNDYFLKYLKNTDGMRDRAQALQRADKLLPWLHREFKKGRALPRTEPGPGGAGFNYMPFGEDWDPNHIVSIESGSPGKERPWFVRSPYVGKSLTMFDLADWQEALEEMKRRGKGVDVMQHKIHELAPKIKDFQDWKEAQKRQDMGEVLHRFDNGWTIRRLQNAEEHKDEGKHMGHCIGGSSYAEETERGGDPNMYVSLRDEKNMPHASLQISPDHWEHEDTGDISHDGPSSFQPSMRSGWLPRVGPRSRGGEFYGKQDREPEPEYSDMVNEWLHENNAPDVEGGRGEADFLTVQPAEDVESYLGIHGENGDVFEWAPETDEDGRPWGEHTELQYSPPEFNRVAQSLLDGRPRYQGGPAPWGREKVADVFHTARGEHHALDLKEELRIHANPEDPHHKEILDQWDRLMQPYYHPYTGEFMQGWRQESPMEEFQNPLFKNVPDNERRPPTPTEPVYGPNGERRWGLKPEGPLTNPYTLWPSYSAARKPLYYRWIFSPTKGVTLGTNQDNHPALVDYHQNLGGEINDTDLTHGYAYPIGNGWRVTDYEHQPVSDPYIVNAVVRRLNLGGAPQMSAQGSWQPTEYDFDRLHYGLPREKTGTF